MSFVITDLAAARSQMAISFVFHIVFAAVGVAMPFLMAISNWRWLKTHDEAYLKLTQIWSKGVAIFFAAGAVSGTALSFELGLLWPKFMLHAGSIIGMPFSWEGTAFFLEAIFIGIFLYGWEKVSPRAHVICGFAVGLCGVASALFVICANGWMNSPSGFDWVGGQAINIDPWAAMFNRAALGEGIHMVIASFVATGFAVGGLHALALLKNPQSDLHKKALRLAVTVGAIAAVIQPLHGDRLAKQVAVLQPIKLAAMEALFHTEKPAAMTLGGFPSEQDETVRYAIRIPKLLSFLANGDFDSEVKGLDTAPREDWPKVAIVHWGFQLMVALGTFLAGVSAFSLFAFWKRNRWLEKRLYLQTLVFCAPLGFLAIEAGWIVTEVGRQPWIIYGIMKTKDAVTPMPGIVYPMAMFSGIYLLLTFLVGFLIMRQYRHVD
jgi:cytochrome d ubiquinol oxidase subunit I